MSAEDWTRHILVIRGHKHVTLGFMLRCWCGRNMRQQRGDDKGWYCRKHGLQAYETDSIFG